MIWSVDRRGFHHFRKQDIIGMDSHLTVENMRETAVSASKFSTTLPVKENEISTTIIDCQPSAIKTIFRHPRKCTYHYASPYVGYFHH